MNVAELIAKLSNLDQSMRVVVNGYETGFDEVVEIQTIEVRPWNPAPPKGQIAAWGGMGKMDCDGELEAFPGGEKVVFFPRISQ